MWSPGLKGHTDVVNMLSWSPDGRTLATACDDMTVRLYRFESVQSKSPHILRLPLDKERAIGVAISVRRCRLTSG